jgi:hypothetical protein
MDGGDDVTAPAHSAKGLLEITREPPPSVPNLIGQAHPTERCQTASAKALLDTVAMMGRY